MKFENTKIFNFEGALRGMRNPKESWHLSDSFFGFTEYDDDNYDIVEEWLQSKGIEPGHENYNSDADATTQWLLKNGILNQNDWYEIADVAFIGPKDMKLAQTLIKAGPEHRKFLRQIFVSVDITAPLYW